MSACQLKNAWWQFYKANKGTFLSREVCITPKLMWLIDLSYISNKDSNNYYPFTVILLFFSILMSQKFLKQFFIYLHKASARLAVTCESRSYSDSEISRISYMQVKGRLERTFYPHLKVPSRWQVGRLQMKSKTLERRDSTVSGKFS